MRGMGGGGSRLDGGECRVRVERRSPVGPARPAGRGDRMPASCALGPRNPRFGLVAAHGRALADPRAPLAAIGTGLASCGVPIRAMWLSPCIVPRGSCSESQGSMRASPECTRQVAKMPRLSDSGSNALPGKQIRATRFRGFSLPTPAAAPPLAALAAWTFHQSRAGESSCRRWWSAVLRPILHITSLGCPRANSVILAGIGNQRNQAT